MSIAIWGQVNHIRRNQFCPTARKNKQQLPNQCCAMAGNQQGSDMVAGAAADPAGAMGHQPAAAVAPEAAAETPHVQPPLASPPGVTLPAVPATDSDAEEGLPSIPQSPQATAEFIRQGEAGKSNAEQHDIATPKQADLPKTRLRDSAAEFKTLVEKVNYGARKMQEQAETIKLNTKQMAAMDRQHKEFIEKTEQDIRRLEGQIRHVESIGGHGERGERSKCPMLNRRGLTDVPKLDGEVESFGDGLFQFKGFLRLEPGLEEYAIFVKGKHTEPVARDIEEYGVRSGSDSAWMDEQMFSLRVSRALAGSKAMSTIKNAEDQLGVGGAAALLRIAHACKGRRGEQRLDTLRDAAWKPKQCTSYAEVLSRVADWEQATREFAMEYPEEGRITDYEKGRILKDMVPDALREDIVRLEKRGYENIHNYITSQIPIRTDEEARKPRGRGGGLYNVEESQVPPPPQAPVGEDAARPGKGWGPDEAAYSMQKGSQKGSGKLSLTGAFTGECHYCKQKGHRRSECEKLTADRAKGIWHPAGSEPQTFVEHPGCKGGQANYNGNKGMNGFTKGGGKGFKGSGRGQ